MIRLDFLTVLFLALVQSIGMKFGDVLKGMLFTNFTILVLCVSMPAFAN